MEKWEGGCHVMDASNSDPSAASSQHPHVQTYMSIEIKANSR